MRVNKYNKQYIEFFIFEVDPKMLKYYDIISDIKFVT